MVDRVHPSEPIRVPRDCSHSTFVLSSVSSIYVQCPHPPIYLPHSHTFLHEGGHVLLIITVLLRFVCSEDTQRGGLEPSYFWVVLGPHPYLR